MNDDLDLAAIEARAAAATTIDVELKMHDAGYERYCYELSGVGAFHYRVDAAFFIHARTDIDALCQEVRRLHSKEVMVYAILNGQFQGDADWTADQMLRAIRAVIEQPEAPATSDPPA